MTFCNNPVALEDKDNPEDGDDEDDENVAEAVEEGNEECPDRKDVVYKVHGYQSIGHAYDTVQNNNSVQECLGRLFENEDNDRSIGDSHTNFCDPS